MTAAILSIGTELTRGELTNTNARWLGERLTELGFEVVEHATVADDAERIRVTLLRLAGSGFSSPMVGDGRETQLIVCTGGLGPTSDDLTAASVAEALGVPLVRDEATLAAITERYRSWKREMPASVARQADVPQGARVLANAVGTAPGFVVDIPRAQPSALPGDMPRVSPASVRAYFMPGVPLEMEHIFETHIVPEIERLAARDSHQVHVRTFGLAESAVAERLRELDLGGAQHTPGVTLGYRVTFPEVEVKVLARASGPDAAETARATAERVAADVRVRLADVAYGGKHDRFPAYVGGVLRAAGWKLALAESCTGGLIGKLLTDPPGSSDYFLGSAVVYANTAKLRMLGVPEQLLRDHGAVSEEVARAMAERVLQISGADVAVAVTGIAGPTGGSKHKPVGTVCFGLSHIPAKQPAAFRGAAADAPHPQTRSRTEIFPGDSGSHTREAAFGSSRDRIRLRAAYVALRMVVDAVKENVDSVSQTREARA